MNIVDLHVHSNRSDGTCSPLELVEIAKAAGLAAFALTDHDTTKGVKEAVDKEGFMGLFSGGFKAGAVGTSAALIFGYLASLVFQSKMKK